MDQRISVIVPVYNVAGELPRCLDSILAQTYSDLEIVAVNDGSGDSSGEVLDRYAAAHPNLRVIHQENAGVTAARLRGVAEATGQWIGFVDGDDYIEPDMYSRLMENALGFGAEISHCGYRMVFSDGRVHYFYNTGALEQQNTLTALKELLSGERIEPGLCNKLFRKTLFADLVMPEDIRINEDLLMNYYLFSAAKQTVYEDRCPYHYMVRVTSASRQQLNSHRIQDPIRVRERILAEAPPALREDALVSYMRTCIYTYHTLLSAGREYRQERAQLRRRLRQEKAHILLLGRKQALMARLIGYLPGLYHPVYGLYSRFLQKSKYS